MRKPLLIASHHVFWALLFAALLLACAPTCAYAYVDPSVMTYTIQALAGVAVAVGAVAGVAFRRTRKMLFKLLKIDENANKVSDANVELYDPADASYEENLEKAGEAARTHYAANTAERPLDHSTKKRALLGLLAGFFFAFTLFIVAPFEVAAGSSASLAVSIHDVWIPIVLFGLAAGLLIGAAVFLFKGRAFDIVLALVCALGICCWAQAMFVNAHLPIADGNTVDWGLFTTMTCISAAMWVIAIAVALVLAIKKPRIARYVCVLGACALILVQGVGLGSIVAGDLARDAGSTYADREEHKAYVTNEGLFTVSPENNVVVFVLDTFDTAIMEELVEEDPSVLDDFTGFTYFKDSTGSMIPTSYALPYLLTGQMIEPGENWDDYYWNKWERSDFVDQIYDAGYSIGVYSDTIQNGTNYIADKTVNIKGQLSGDTVNGLSAALILEKTALYRDAPWVLKRFFTFTTDEVNNSIVNKTEENYDRCPYTIDDVAYYERLCSHGIEATNEGAQGAFRLIHLAGAHTPFTMNEDCEYVAEGVTVEEQAAGSLNIVAEYLRQLDELGLRESTTVIVTADHGWWYFTTEPLDKECSPLMMVKPAQSAEEDAQPCVTSTARISHEDFHPTVLEAVGGDASSYGDDGKTVFEIDDPNRIRYYDMTTDDGDTVIDALEYEIDGNALDFDSWRLTGQTWPLR